MSMADFECASESYIGQIFMKIKRPLKT